MIEIIDNFLTAEQAAKLENHAKNCEYARNQFSDRDATTSNLRFAHRFDPKMFDQTDIMEAVREKLGDVELIGAYINAADFATSTLSHVDDYDEKCVTVLLYLNREWSVDYQGATMFFDGFGSSDVLKAVMPKSRRAAIFDSNIWHMACSPSHHAPVRYTLAIKLRRKDG